MNKLIGGNIGMKDAYIKLEDSSFWDNFEEEISKNHATVLGIELTERNYIDTKEAIWRENFVLTKKGVEYAKRLLQDEISSFGSEKESEDDDKPF